MKPFFDSPHSDDFVDPIRVSVTPIKTFPIREDLTAINYSIEYAHRVELFQPSPLGMKCPDDPKAILVGETNPMNEGNGIVKFIRTFSTIPSNRNEFETGTFIFPSFKDRSSSTTTRRTTISRNGVIKVSYSYILTTDPENDIILTDQFSPKDASGNDCNFIATDTNPTFPDYISLVNSGGYLQAKQTEISRWMGDIWQIRNQVVKAR